MSLRLGASGDSLGSLLGTAESLAHKGTGGDGFISEGLPGRRARRLVSQGVCLIPPHFFFCVSGRKIKVEQELLSIAKTEFPFRCLPVKTAPRLFNIFFCFAPLSFRPLLKLFSPLFVFSGEEGPVRRRAKQQIPG